LKPGKKGEKGKKVRGNGGAWENLRGLLIRIRALLGTLKRRGDCVNALAGEGQHLWFQQPPKGGKKGGRDRMPRGN